MAIYSVLFVVLILQLLHSRDLEGYFISYILGDPQVYISSSSLFTNDPAIYIPSSGPAFPFVRPIKISFSISSCFPAYFFFLPLCRPATITVFLILLNNNIIFYVVQVKMLSVIHGPLSPSPVTSMELANPINSLQNIHKSLDWKKIQ